MFNDYLKKKLFNFLRVNFRRYSYIFGFSNYVFIIMIFMMLFWGKWEYLWYFRFYMYIFIVDIFFLVLFLLINNLFFVRFILVFVVIF